MLLVLARHTSPLDSAQSNFVTSVDEVVHEVKPITAGSSPSYGMGQQHRGILESARACRLEELYNWSGAGK